MANRLSVRMMREAGLGTAESDLLRLVKQRPGISQKEACAQLGMDKGAVARRVVNLEQKGYLTRRSNPSDARSQLLFPEPKTERMNDAGASTEDVFYDWLLEGLSEAGRSQFCEALHVLEERAKKESEAGFPNVCGRMQREEIKPQEEPESQGEPKPQEEQTQGESRLEPEKRSRRPEPDIWLL